jgi:CrcB protein
MAGMMERLAAYLWVAVGGALGSVARFWLSGAVAALTGPQFPWGTLLINIVGSFVIGWFGALTSDVGPLDAPANVRLFVLVGICGGFTTFSSFSLQTLELLQSGEMARAVGYIAGSVALCLLGVWAGVALVRG